MTEITHTATFDTGGWDYYTVMRGTTTGSAGKTPYGTYCNWDDTVQLGGFDPYGSARAYLYTRVFPDHPEANATMTLARVAQDVFVDFEHQYGSLPYVLIEFRFKLADGSTEPLYYYGPRLSDGTWFHADMNLETPLSVKYVDFYIWLFWYNDSTPAVCEMRQDNLLISDTALSTDPQPAVGVTLDGNDISEDVFSASVEIGFAGPFDEIAAVGRAEIVLNNHDKQYSPGNAVSSFHDSLKPRKKVTITRDWNGTTHTLFTGYVERIAPTAGVHRERKVKIDCVDALALLKGVSVDLELQTDVRSDQLLQTLLNTAYAWETGQLDLDTGQSVFAFAGDSWTAANTPLMGAVGDVVKSEFGRLYCTREGVLRFRNREYVTALHYADAVRGHFEDDMQDLAYRMDAANIVNRAEIFVYPRDKSIEKVVYGLALPVAVQPGDPVVLKVPFRDLNTGRFAAAVDVITPVAGTDFAVKDANGADYTASSGLWGLSMTTTATTATITFSSAAGRTLYFPDFQIRGKVLDQYEPIMRVLEDADSQSAFGRRVMRYHMPLMEDWVAADYVAQHIVIRGRYPRAYIPALTIAHTLTTSQNGVEVLDLNLLDPVNVTETQTGLGLHRLYIYRIAHDIREGGRYHTVTLGLEPSPTNTGVWLLGITTHSELDETTILGV